MTHEERSKYFEAQYREAKEESDYYRTELAKAHTILGRIIHQASERWDSFRTTEFFPTDNLDNSRRVGNAQGSKRGSTRRAGQNDIHV